MGNNCFHLGAAATPASGWLRGAKEANAMLGAECAESVSRRQQDAPLFIGAASRLGDGDTAKAGTDQRLRLEPWDTWKAHIVANEWVIESSFYPL